MNPHAISEVDLPRERAPLKFAFASGSRPLAGYTIKRGVGRGGFGEVYYAVSDAGKEVALKLIRRNLDVELRGVTQCLNLKHPHLLALFDVKQDDEDNSWVIMEYVSGESLEAAIERHPQGMPLAEALDWMRGIGAGVAYLHDHGIVHRDLKPGNIFCDQGMVKLGDYGLAKFISCSRRSGQTESVGTVHYMAPEVANGRYGKQIDIYALGVIFYEMLTGHVPFEGESVGEVLMKHLTAAPDVSIVAEPYRQIVARMLAKDPDVRFNSVDELLAELPAQGAGSGPATLRVVRPVAGLGEGASHPPIPPAPSGRAPVAPQLGNAAAPTVVVVDEEPIWKALRETAQKLRVWWDSTGLNTPSKVVILVLAVFVLGANAGRIMAFVMPVVFVYGVYRLVRFLMLPTTQQYPQPTASPVQPAVTAYHRPESSQSDVLPASGPAPAMARVAQNGPAAKEPALPAVYMRPHGMRRNWHEQAVAALVIKPPRLRAAELCGSMLWSCGVACVISLVLLLVRGKPVQPEQFAWLALVGTVGAWVVLLPSKLWEGTKGDAVQRRFVMLIAGLALGAAAYGLKQLLMVDLPFDLPGRRSSIASSFGTGFYGPDGSPLLYAYLTYFGFLFLAVRWWRQADPLRSTRLSLAATAAGLVVAWLLYQVWPFPQPWGYMVAVTVSIAVQLSSPWSSAKKRWLQKT